MDISEYKVKKIKTYKLKSDLVVKTKSLTPYTIMKIRRDFESKEENKGKEFWDSLYVIDELFHEFLVDPRVPEDMVVDDFLRDDFIELHEMMMKQITLTKAKGIEEVVQTDKDFRH